MAVHNGIVVEETVFSPPKKRQKEFDEEAIIMGERLTHIEINLAQRILKSQFAKHQWTSFYIISMQAMYCS